MEIRLAKPNELAAIKRIAEDNRRELGFSTTATYSAAINAEEMIVSQEKSRVLGYCHFHLRRDNVLKVYQICVDRLHRRNGIGTGLMNYVITYTIRRGGNSITLLCPDDLEANLFYGSYGFVCGQLVAGKKRQLRIWSMVID